MAVFSDADLGSADTGHTSKHMRFILPTSHKLGGRPSYEYHTHFTNEEMETQGSKIACPNYPGISDRDGVERPCFCYSAQTGLVTVMVKFAKISRYTTVRWRGNSLEILSSHLG